MPAQANAVWCCSKCGAIYHKDYPRCPADGAEIVLHDRDPLVGKQIDHYVIEKVIGEGGMGRVYRGHHAMLTDKIYAIKVLLGDVAATASMRKRFEREAETASRIDHPNLVGVVDYGATTSGLPYIVMDFVEGQVLTDILVAAPMEPARVVKLARAICEGLAYAHDAGLIHRDLKPDNVIVTSGDVPRVTDFGLVLPTEEGTERLTSTGMAMGTPAYAAPEQMAGKTIDLRVDLFSLGLSMFEMLTGGKLPWEGGAMEIAAAKAHKDAPTVSQRAPDVRVAADLEALVARLLARKPDERPSSAREVIDLLDGLAVAGQRIGTHVKTMKTPITRSRQLAMLAAGVVLAAAGVGAAAWAVTKRHDAPIASPSPSPSPSPPPSPSPSPSPVAVAEAAPEIEMPVDTSTHNHSRSPHPTSPHPSHPSPRPSPHHPSPLTVAPPPPTLTTATSPAAAELTPLPPPPPPHPVELHAAIAGVEVHGSLPAADVERAVNRILPALEKCAPTSAQQITAQLTIGEARRAENVRASGGAASTCVAAALAALRTEAAPDVGDVEVSIRVAFAER